MDDLFIHLATTERVDKIITKYFHLYNGSIPLNAIVEPKAVAIAP